MQNKVEVEVKPIELAITVKTRTRLASIIYFRATAIILIVAGHSFSLADIKLESTLDNVFSLFVKGSTALFVFLSGFLFDYVSSSNFKYKTFIRAKISRLLVPYLILTTLAEIIFWDLKQNESIANKIYRDFVFGSTFQAYWYIPFILMMFALAPLHRVFTNWKVSVQILCIAVTTIVAAIIQRPLGNDNVFQSIIFYLPIYLSGMFLSETRATSLAFVRNNLAIFLILAGALLVIQLLSGQSDNMQKTMFSFGGLELMGMQKLSLSFAMFSIFLRLPVQPHWLINLVAETSFAIFFLHPFVLRLAQGSNMMMITNVPWLDLVFATFAVVSACVLLAVGIRLILKGSSKYVIGY